MTALEVNSDTIMADPIQQRLDRIAGQIRAIRESKEINPPRLEKDGDFFSFRNSFVCPESSDVIKHMNQLSSISARDIAASGEQLRGSLKQAVELIEKLRAANPDVNEFNQALERLQARSLFDSLLSIKRLVRPKKE